MKRNIVWKRISILVFFLAGTLFSFSGQAQTCTVNSTADNNAGGGNLGTFAYCTEGAFNVINFSVPNGSVIPFRAVEINKAVTINGNPTVTLDGSGAYQKNPWNTNMITIIASNVVVNDLVMTNATGAAAWDGSGILIGDGLTNITLNNVDITNSKNAGVATSTWVAAGNSLGTSNLTITGGNYSLNGTSGINIANSNNLQVSGGGTFNNNNEHGVYLNGVTYVAGAQVPSTDLANAVGVTNSTITNITASNNGQGVAGNGAGIVVEGNSTGNMIDGVTTNGNNEHGLWLRLASSNNTIQNSTSNNNGGGTLAAGINVSLGGNSNNIIRDNSVAGNQDFGIYLYDNYGSPNNNNRIEGNTVTTSGAHGIYILNSTRTFVRNNIVHGNGTVAARDGDGINFGNSSSNGEISGNEVYNNDDNGINVTAGNPIPADVGDPNTVLIPKGGSNDNTIFNNHVGILRTGVLNGNKASGILISESSGNQVGVGGRNFVSGNEGHGIHLNLLPNGATTSIIQNNYVGTNLLGTADNGNKLSGIYLTGSKDVRVLDNLVSGNDRNGIELGNAATNGAADIIDIRNNKIGTDVTGLLKIANTQAGILVDNAQFVNIGNGTAGGRNIVSGNGGDGITISNDAANVTVNSNYIGLDVNGSHVSNLGNGGDGIDMTGAHQNSLQNNHVSANVGNGIIIQQSSGATNPNTVSNNVIGLNVTGAAAGNGIDGIRLTDNSSKNVIDNNTIGFNAGDGISILISSTQNEIINNHIGINATNGSIANDGDGIQIDGTSSGNIIGKPGNGNFISFNKQNGIRIMGGAAVNVNTIQSNRIGVGATTAINAANGLNGVLLEANATNNTIGGAGAGEGNIIAGTHDYQIYVSANANDNRIYGNLIGTVNGTTTATNLQADNNAVYITGANNTKVGGVGANGNVIAHNGGLTGNNAAVLIEGTADGNDVSGNNIGMQTGGLLPLGALVTGVEVRGGATNNKIGEAAGNTIGQASADAIHIHGTTTTGTRVSKNKIGVQSNGTTVSTGITGHGIHINGAVSTTIDSNIVAKVLGGNDAVFIENSATGISVITANNIGTSNGTTSLGTTGNGIRVLNSSFTGGGLTVSTNNIQSATLDGILLDGSSRVTINGGNGIGTNTLNGTVANGNTLNGIHLVNGNSNVTIASNKINGNTLNGILVDGAHTNVIIQTNRIGVTDGNVINKNDLNGVLLNGGTNVSINTGNIIGGHTGGTNAGIKLTSTSTSNTIDANWIGIETGGANLGNRIGVLLEGSSTGNTINANNVSHNVSHGIELNASGTNTITANFIGALAASLATSRANGGDGIFVGNTSSGNTISLNTIGHQKAPDVGVRISDAGSVGNIISRNSMFCNEGSNITTRGTGIALNAAGNNDFPQAAFNTVAPIYEGGVGNLYLSAAIPSIPDGSIVEVFSTDNNCTNCQGKGYVGQTTTTAGNFSYAIGIGDCSAATYVITIRELGTNNTSEFSSCSVCPPCTQAIVDAGDDGETCQTTAFDLSTRGTVATETDAVTLAWVDIDSISGLSAGGSFNNTATLNPIYTPLSTYSGTVYLILTGTSDQGPCVDAVDSISVVVNPSPTVNAGDDTEICQDMSVNLITVTATRVNVADSLNSPSVAWADGGAGGAFDDNTLLNPTYTPLAGTSGNVTLTITAQPYGSCASVNDAMILTVTAEPLATITPATASTCGLTEYTGLGGTSSNGSSISWADTTSTGTAAGGTFAPATGSDTPGYTPAVADGSSFTLIKTIGGNGSCPDTSVSMVLTVNAGPTVAAGSDFSICENATLDLSTRTPDIASVTGATGQTWTLSPNVGSFDDATLVNPTYTPQANFSGTVTMTLTGAGTAPCTAVADDFDLVIVALPSPAITGDADLCENATNEAYSSNALATNTLAWTTNGGLSVNGASNGVNVNIDMANTSGDLMLSETLTLPSGATCVGNATKPIAVVLLPVVEAGIAQNTCVDAAYTLDGSASVSAGTFVWTIEATAGGALSNASTLTPTYTPANPADASKTFVLTLTGTTTSVGGSCVATDVMNLTVNPLPTPTITGNAAPCENATPEVYQTSTAYAGYVWSNDFTATENNGTTNATYSLGIPASGTGDVFVTVTDANGCTGSDDHEVSIITSSAPDFNQVTPAICDKDGVVKGDLASTGISPGDESLYRFTWYRGTAPDETDLLSPTKNGDASADLNVADGEDVYLKAELISGVCPSSPGTAVNAGPVVVDLSPDLTGSPMLDYCVNDNLLIEFTDASTGTAGYTPTYTWKLNGNSISGSTLTKNDQIGSAGNNTYELTGVNGLCTEKETVGVLIKQPVVSASVSDGWIDKGSSITVSASHGGSSETYNYSWTTNPTGESGDGQTARSFSSTPGGSTIYSVTSGLLDVADPSSPNCIVTADVRVTVTSPPLPDEVFSPGNNDGVNDFWRIQFLNATDYPNNVVKVYNRWGNIVYKGEGYDYDGLTTTPETAKEKWDGTRNGNLVPVATYYYVIELNDPDDTLLSGAITIIR